MWERLLGRLELRPRSHSAVLFQREWLGPVVPCPSDVATLVLPLAVTLLSVRPAKKGDKNRPSGRAGDVLISLGALAALVLAVAIVAGYLHASSMSGALAAWTLTQSLALPCEAVAVAGWVLLAPPCPMMGLRLLSSTRWPLALFRASFSSCPVGYALASAQSTLPPCFLGA